MKNAYYIRLTIAAIVGMLAIAAVLGFYPLKLMDLQLSALAQRVIVDFSITALVVLLGSIIFALLFGRFYCSTICPLGIFQEFLAILFKKKGSIQKNRPFKYYIAALVFGALIGGSALLIRYADPYTMFSSAVSLSILGLVFVFAISALVLYNNRYFCSNICPTGAVLGLVSKVSVNKIYINKDNCVSCGLCAKSCPVGCIDHKEKTVDSEVCIKCLKCLKECKKGAIKYGIKKTKNEKINLSRRKFIYATSALLVFGGAIKAGVEISKNFANKVKNIILPPGAENANRMANKCLNCNLCINNCPNKILTRANKDFPAVHIDYTKGEGFCKYDCNECSKTCPTGAIKRVSLEEKQSTRIAMASIKLQDCTRCGHCAKVCPVGAISLDEKRQPCLDGAKCIGCAKCAKKCRPNAIEIYAVNEQQII